MFAALRTKQATSVPRLALAARSTLPRRTFVSTSPARRAQIFESADEAVKDIAPGSTVLSAGFGLCGTPETLIQALERNPQVTNLTVVSNNAGTGEQGLGKSASPCGTFALAETDSEAGAQASCSSPSRSPR